jgi:hypothetical protein
VPAPFEHIVDRALAKKPAERYPRAGEMARELRDFRNVQPRSTPARLALAGEPSGGPSTGVRVDAVRSQLINDLDKFVEQYDREEKDRLQQEEAEQRKKEEQMRRWGEEQAREREAFERARQNPAAAAAGELEAAMRAALQSLTGLAQQLNSVRPGTARPYEFMYLGRLPKVSISEAAVESQPRTLQGQTLTERILMRFRITPKPAATVTLVGEDIERCEQYLKLLKVPYTQRVLPKNSAGKAIRAEISVTGSLPCEIDMKPDYAANKVAVELTNVRRLGRVVYHLAPRSFSEAVGHLAHYLLGGDDDFETVARAG